MNIQEVREKYPQYQDLSDAELARGLHKKYYSDMDFNDFSTRIGLVQTPGPTPAIEAVQGDQPMQAINQLALEAGRERSFQATKGLMLGEVAKGIYDWMGKEISDLTPQFVKDWMSDELGALSWVTETPIGQKAVRAIAAGEEKLKEFQEAYPEQSAQLEAAMNIGGLLAGPAAVSRKGPTGTYQWGKPIGPRKPKGGDYLDDYLMRYQNKAEQTEQAFRTDVVGRGPLKRNIIRLDRQQQQNKAVLKTVPGVKKGMTQQEVLNAVQAEIPKESSRLKIALRKSGKKVSRTEVRKSVDNLLTKLWDNEPDFADISPKIRERIVNQVVREFDKHPATLEGLWKTRIGIDRIINQKTNMFRKMQQGRAVLQSPTVTPQDLAYAATRDSLNQLLQMKAGGTPVKATFRRLSSLYDMRDNMAPIAGYEPKWHIQQRWQNIKEGLGMGKAVTSQLIPKQK